jgi:hypothetical protein
MDNQDRSAYLQSLGEDLVQETWTNFVLALSASMDHSKHVELSKGVPPLVLKEVENFIRFQKDMEEATRMEKEEENQKYLEFERWKRKNTGLEFNRLEPRNLGEDYNTLVRRQGGLEGDCEDGRPAIRSIEEPGQATGQGWEPAIMGTLTYRAARKEGGLLRLSPRLARRSIPFPDIKTEPGLEPAINEEQEESSLVRR